MLMFPLPDRDRRGVPFDPVLVDDVRSVLLMQHAGRRTRANWMLLRTVRRHPPDEVGRLLRAMCLDTRTGT